MEPKDWGAFDQATAQGMYGGGGGGGGRKQSRGIQLMRLHGPGLGMTIDLRITREARS